MLMWSSIEMGDSQRIEVLQASSDRDIDAAFGALVQRRASALVVTADGFFLSQRDQLIDLAARHLKSSAHGLHTPL
jgi:hypothetical protein